MGFTNIINTLQKLWSLKGVIPTPNKEPDGPIAEEAITDPFPVAADTSIEKILTPEVVKRELFKFTPLKNIQTMLPLILQAMQNREILDEVFICYVLATIYVENDVFYPCDERPSKWSTKGGKPPYDFSNYEGRKDLSNINPGDGALFHGRGLIQITGRSNYEFYDKRLGLDGGLVENPDAANEPHIAAVILVEYLKDRETKIREALAKRDFKLARTFVNGRAALHWEKMKDAYLIIEKLLN